jgi:hypothetical protein
MHQILEIDKSAGNEGIVFLRPQGKDVAADGVPTLFPPLQQR